MVAWYIGHYWQEARKAAYARVKIVADNTASNIEDILRDNEAVLGQLAERPLVRALDPRHCDPVLAQYISVRPEYSTLAVRDAQANIVCTLLSNPPSAQLVKNSAWFQEAMRTGRFTVSDATFRPSPRGWVSISAFPIRDDKNKVSGFVFFSIDLLRLNRHLFQLPGDAVVAVADGSGKLLLRSADPEQWIGKAPPHLTSAEFQGQQEGYFSRQGVDNIKRLYAFVPVPGTSWWVFAGLPEDEVLADSRERLIHGIAIGCAALLLVLILAYRVSSAIVNPIRGLARVSAAIAGGDTTARADLAGPPEIERVARQFNEMLDVRDRVEERLRRTEGVLLDKNRQLAEAVEKLETARNQTLRAERSALDYAERLRAMSRRMVEVQESEQRSLARDLHDSVSSSLAVVGLELHTIEGELAAESLAKVGPRLSDCIELVKAIMENARDISSDLHSATLDYAGLAAALEDLGSKFAKRTKLAIDVTVPEQRQRAPADAEVALFRIAQEAITNCVKHAHASRAAIELSFQEAHVSLSIADDGQGFDPVEVAQGGSRQGLGLLLMRERAEAAGGELHIDSTRGKGTRVVVRLPCCSELEHSPEDRTRLPAV